MTALFLLACATAESPVAASTPTPEPASVTAPAAPPSGWVVALGESVDSTVVVPVDTLVNAADAWNGKDVVIDGVVKEVCQKKGCWHTISTASPDVTVMAKDKEYKVFLPKDAAGQRVHVKGTFAAVETPEEEARHYAEDAGRDPSTIVGPQKGYAVDVAGVKFVEG